MVLYFTSNTVDPPAAVYMGKDKFENEDLIKHGWPEDVWFHVDKLSSAHVYLRLPKGQTWDAIPKPLLDDLAQLCKANSIKGNKMDNLTIIYTPWSNLLKRGDMAVGQVSFKQPKMVKRVLVVSKDNELIKRLNKTKVERQPDLRQERLNRDKEERREKHNVAKKKAVEERKTVEDKKKEKEERDYSRVFAAAAAQNDQQNKKKKGPVDLFGEDSDEDDINGYGSSDSGGSGDLF